MPDGPHRSLPLTPAWKRLSRWAENPANRPEDGLELLKRALESDWHDGSLGQHIADLRKIAAAARSLSPRDAVRLVEDVRRSAAGSPLALSLLDWFVRLLSRNGTEGPAMSRAVTDALRDRVARGLRQIEEHALRKCNETRVAEISLRLDQVVNKSDFFQIARDLLERRNGDHRRPLPKKTGLHHGPPLP